MGAKATRRELAAGALAATGAAAGAAAFTGAADPAAAAIPRMTTPEWLANALVIERLMVLAYQRVLASATITPTLERMLNEFLGHELEHVSAIAAQLSALGQAAPTGPLDLASAEALLSKHGVTGSLAHLPPTEGDRLVLLVDLESVAEGAYFNQLRDVTSPTLIRLSAQIMSCEAQHWTVLMQILNPGQIVKAVPWPFVLGTS